MGGPKPTFWDPKNKKNKNSQNQNPFCPKCREYFFKPEKNLPGPIWGPPGPFFAWAGKIQKKCQKIAYFPWWAHGPYSPGLEWGKMQKQKSLGACECPQDIAKDMCNSLFWIVHVLESTISTSFMFCRIGKIGNIFAFFWFFRPTQKIGREGPKWGGDAFFRHKKPRQYFGQNGFWFW